MDPLTEAPPLLALWGTGAAIVVLLVALGAVLRARRPRSPPRAAASCTRMADRGERGAAAALALDRGQGAADRRGPARQQPRQHPRRLARHRALHPALRRRRRRVAARGDDGAGADLRRGDAEDLRDHQPRGRGGPGRPADRASSWRCSSPPVTAVRGASRGWCCGSSGSRPTRRRSLARPRSRRSPATIALHHSEGSVENGRPRPAARRARPRRAAGRGGDDAPPRHRDDRRRGAARPRSSSRRSTRRTPASRSSAASRRTSSA